jgi:hypothetical protein
MLLTEIIHDGFLAVPTGHFRGFKKFWTFRTELEANDASHYLAHHKNPHSEYFLVTRALNGPYLMFRCDRDFLTDNSGLRVLAFSITEKSARAIGTKMANEKGISGVVDVFPVRVEPEVELPEDWKDWV